MNERRRHGARTALHAGAQDVDQPSQRRTGGLAVRVDQEQRQRAARALDQVLPRERNAVVYLYDGELRIAGPCRAVPCRSAAVLGEGDRLRLQAGAQGARLLLLAARPIGEPVVQYGPFVMNTREQIEQALDDYRHGRLHARRGASSRQPRAG